MNTSVVKENIISMNLLDAGNGIPNAVLQQIYTEQGISKEQFDELIRAFVAKDNPATLVTCGSLYNNLKKDLERPYLSLQLFVLGIRVINRNFSTISIKVA